MFPLLAIIFGLFGAVVDELLKTHFVFQCFGVTIGYFIWVKDRVSLIANNKMRFGTGSALWVLIVTWCTTFFSGAPALGLQTANEISELRSLLWTILSLIIGTLVIFFHWEASQSAKAEFLASRYQANE